MNAGVNQEKAIWKTFTDSLEMKAKEILENQGTSDDFAKFAKTLMIERIDSYIKQQSIEEDDEN